MLRQPRRNVKKNLTLLEKLLKQSTLLLLKNKLRISKKLNLLLKRHTRLLRLKERLRRPNK